MKRALDLLLVILALPVWVPVLVVLSMMVRASIGSPIVFTQVRPGMNGRPFKLIKLRTMTNAVDAAGKLLTDAERLTEFGSWIRATSLDELPELWNVLRGEMSLVGPRPLLTEYLPLYSSDQARRHTVPPGVTGWAQVNGRNAITWEEKFRLDIWYVDHRTMWLDLKILLLTLMRVFLRHGISAAGEATMPRFVGSSFANVASDATSPALSADSRDQIPPI